MSPQKRKEAASTQRFEPELARTERAAGFCGGEGEHLENGITGDAGIDARGEPEADVIKQRKQQRVGDGMVTGKRFLSRCL